MKFQSSTLLNKDVQNFTSFYTFSCGKLCGNCGKHSKIAIFVNFQTDVLVENYLQEITSLPDDVIENIEKKIRGTDCTFSAFVIEAVKVALENLE